MSRRLDLGLFKEAVIGILTAVAKQERVRLSERTIAGLQRGKAKGPLPKQVFEHCL
jgi:DNA invertase Pin-like site-specific DNA recombinase